MSQSTSKRLSLCVFVQLCLAVAATLTVASTVGTKSHVDADVDHNHNLNYHVSTYPTTSPGIHQRVTELRTPRSVYNIRLGDNDRPNLLVLIADQLRFDCLRHIQDPRNDFDGLVKIRTPNLDRLAASGVTFTRAYSGSASCSPARAILMTGNSLQKTGLTGNKLIMPNVYRRMSIFQERIERMQTFEQLLVQQRGYLAESFGKWHVPMELLYRSNWKQKKAIKTNFYDITANKPTFSTELYFKVLYRKVLSAMLKRDGVTVEYKPGQQENGFTKMPYTPIQLDSRYGRKGKTTLKKNDRQFQTFEQGSSSTIGRDSLSTNYTTTGVLGQTALLAMDRLARSNQPWSLTINFNSPHPPMIAPGEFLDYYWENRRHLYVPPNYADVLKNTPYKTENARKKFLKAGYPFNEKGALQELASVYYGLVEELDYWIGKVLLKLDLLGLSNNTMVVFTSDHGESLGAHSMIGKGVLLEEAIRVPLIASFPGQIPAGTIVNDPVSHMDVFPTILDYLHVQSLDESDGNSLRNVIEGTSYNSVYDERVVVVELEKRYPVSSSKLSSKLGSIPNFAVVRGNHKLIISRGSKSPVLDMLFDLARDPYETKNLIGKRGANAKNAIIGKAEHLKILLIEWMLRMDGQGHFYTDNRYNGGEGRGDVYEVRSRRTWKEVDYWHSDNVLSFGRQVLVTKDELDRQYCRNEFVYFGRTTPGNLKIYSLTVKGEHAEFITLSQRKALIKKDKWIKVKVSVCTSEPLLSLSAYIQVRNNVNGERKIILSL